MNWTMLHPQMTEDRLGYLPGMLSDRDPRSAKEQFNAGYARGGGWRPMDGFKLLKDNTLYYPGDPAMKPLAKTTLRDELILFYPHDWVVIVQPDRSFEACRMD